MTNQKGFTLIEMMIVLMIISVLLIITIPNVTKNNDSINAKGCEAYIKMVQAQVQAYEIDHNQLPTTIQELITKGYLKEENRSVCGKDQVITILDTGEVTTTTITATTTTP
jgi:competence protein ComGC